MRSDSAPGVVPAQPGGHDIEDGAIQNRPLAADALFRDVEHARFEHVHELPREALHDHLMSYSGVAALSEAERRPLFSEVAALLDSDQSVSVDGRLRLPFVVTAYRATRA